MEEYFAVFSDDFGSFFSVFVPWALEIGMIMIILELVVGVAVLLNYRMQLTTKVLLGLMVFFTFLTFYSAYFNKVTDCGCFGDAIKLTPWQSFIKDVILMIPVLHLFWHRKRYQSVLRTMEGHVVIGATTALCFFLGIYAIRHLPFIDFRAYRVGKNIPAQMQPEEQPKFEYVFIKKDDGQRIASEKYLTDTTLYKYESVRQTNEDKTRPKITDYAVMDVDGNDVTYETFQGAKLIIIIYDVTKASTSNIEDIRNLINALDGKLDIMIFTASSGKQFETFRHEHQLAAPYYFVDATVLKTIVRANPGLTLWVDGTVMGMWHHNDTPTPEDVMELVNATSSDA